MAEKQCQIVDQLEGEEKKSYQYVPKMCLLRKITYGEFSEFVREKKITYNVHSILIHHVTHKVILRMVQQEHGPNFKAKK